MSVYLSPQSDNTRAYKRALRVAEAIESFWHAHGYPGVKAWPALCDPHERYRVWKVKSNLINGLPAKIDPWIVGVIYRKRRQS